MKKKTKIMGLAVLFGIFLLPMFGGMLMSLPQAGIYNEVEIDPVRNYRLSADPTVSSVPIVTNEDDTNNLYGGNYKTYLITATVTNAVSIADVGAITITFNTTTAILCGVQYSNVTALWTEHATNAGYITATATNTTAVNDMAITVSVQVDWTFPDQDNVYIHIAVYNATGSGIVRAESAITYDIDTDLTLASTDLIVAATEPGGDLMALNTLIYSYEDSGGDNYPLAAQTDFWVTRAASTSGAVLYDAESWQSTGYSDVDGVATFAQILSIGGGEHTESFNLFAVTQSGGSGGSTLMGSTQTETVTIGYAGVRDPGDDSIIPDITDFTFEQKLAIVGAGLVLVVGIAYILKDTSGSTLKIRKRKTLKKKRKRRKK